MKKLLFLFLLLTGSAWGQGYTPTTCYGVTACALQASAVQFNPRGAWGASAIYHPGDVVTYAGSTYFATTTFTSGSVFDGVPPWSLMAQGATSNTASLPIVLSGAAIGINDFTASGTSHANGAVPDPGASAGTTHYLREDATWVAPTVAIGSGVTGLGTGVATGLGNAVTGSGSPVLATSPTLVTPALGTPSALVLTNATGLPNGSVIGLTGYATATFVTNTTITVGTSAISANACNTVSTVSMTGLASTMTVHLTPNSDISAITGWSPGTGGQLYFTDWVTSGTYHYYVCNPTSATITPGSSTTWNVSAR